MRLKFALTSFRFKYGVNDVLKALLPMVPFTTKNEVETLDNRVACFSGP